MNLLPIDVLLRAFLLPPILTRDIKKVAGGATFGVFADNLIRATMGHSAGSLAIAANWILVDNALSTE